jgi:hypothetical protein
VNVALCAAARLRGKLIPLMLNPVPLGVIWEIVSAEPPEFVRVSESDVLLPTETLPKFKLVGLATSCPGVVPVPDRATFRLGLDALDVIVIPPATVPDDVGANVALKLALCPTFRVSGKLKPLIVKLFVAATAEIVRLDPPEFVNV